MQKIQDYLVILLNQLLVSGLASAGMHVYTLRTFANKWFSNVNKKMDANLGIMITASHNPYYDNGLKFLVLMDLNLSDKIERKIKKLIDKKINNKRYKSRKI